MAPRFLAHGAEFRQALRALARQYESEGKMYAEDVYRAVAAEAALLREGERVARVVRSDPLGLGMADPETGAVDPAVDGLLQRAAPVAARCEEGTDGELEAALSLGFEGAPGLLHWTYSRRVRRVAGEAGALVTLLNYRVSVQEHVGAPPETLVAFGTALPNDQPRDVRTDEIELEVDPEAALRAARALRTALDDQTMLFFALSVPVGLSDQDEYTVDVRIMEQLLDDSSDGEGEGGEGGESGGESA